MLSHTGMGGDTPPEKGYIITGMQGKLQIKYTRELRTQRPLLIK